MSEGTPEKVPTVTHVSNRENSAGFSDVKIPVEITQLSVETQLNTNSKTNKTNGSDNSSFDKVIDTEDDNDSHPENSKRFPIWKRIILHVGEGLAVIGTVLFWLPIPIGIATLTLSVGLIGIAVGPKHAKKHVEKIFKVVSKPFKWFFGRLWNDFKKDMKRGTWSEKWLPKSEEEKKKKPEKA